MDWDPELAGPILRQIIDRVVTELLEQGDVRIDSLIKENADANRKTVENVIDQLANFGAIRKMQQPKRTIRLTTLGKRWADDWFKEQT